MPAFDHIDAHEGPSPRMREFFKVFQKQAPDLVACRPDLVDLRHAGELDCLEIVDTIPSSRVGEAFDSFLGHNSQHTSVADVPVYQLKSLPGISLTSETEFADLSPYNSPRFCYKMLPRLTSLQDYLLFPLFCRRMYSKPSSVGCFTEIYQIPSIIQTCTYTTSWNILLLILVLPAPSLRIIWGHLSLAIPQIRLSSLCRKIPASTAPCHLHRH